MRHTIKLLTLALFAVMSTSAHAQQKQFTLEDLNYGGKNYRHFVPAMRYYTWWGDVLVRTEMDKCMTVDKQTGAETTLFTLAEINSWGEQTDDRRVRHLYNAAFPYADKSYVMLYNGSERLLIDWEQKTLVWRGAPRSEAGTSLEWNEASRAEAFLKDDNLYVVDAEGQRRQLSTDGSREIVYGQSVHRDEFGIEKGTFWSPDGQRLAFYRMDQSMVADYPQVNVNAKMAEHAPDKYPMAGQTSHKVSIGIYDLATQQTRYLHTADPTDRYFTNLAWAPDNKTLYVMELNRDQNHAQLIAYNTDTGEPTGAPIYEEKNEKYVEPQHPITFLPWDDKQFVMQSEKDGYNHLYLYDTKGKEVKQLTKGNFEVMDLLGFDVKRKAVVIRANAHSPIEHNLYTVSVKHGRMTPLDNQRGVHNATLSASGEWLLDNYSEPDVPRVIDVVSTDGAKPYTHTLLKADDPWKGYDVPEYSCGTIKAADGTTDLYYRMVKPTHFDPTKKYPTIIYVYGGPHAHNVDARWHYSSRSWETYMAQKGYLLFILDNRGSELRGQAFEQATFRQLGQAEMADQMEGVKFLKSLPYVDADRMGVHGWSFGGFMTISLMTNYPDVFKVGVAGGPVIDWHWYEVMYGERYMDTPQSNPEGYAKTSLMAKAKDLKGKLQIITGYNDATVVPQHCLEFIDACIEAGTQPDFFVYPGEPHNMRGHKSVHLHERISQYFDDYLK